MVSWLKIWNQSIPSPTDQARSASLGEGADYDSECKNIDTEEKGPCHIVVGWLPWIWPLL